MCPNLVFHIVNLCVWIGFKFDIGNPKWQIVWLKLILTNLTIWNYFSNQNISTQTTLLQNSDSGFRQIWVYFQTAFQLFNLLMRKKFFRHGTKYCTLAYLYNLSFSKHCQYALGQQWLFTYRYRQTTVCLFCNKHNLDILIKFDWWVIFVNCLKLWNMMYKWSTYSIQCQV